MQKLGKSDGYYQIDLSALNYVAPIFSFFELFIIKEAPYATSLLSFCYLAWLMLLDIFT